MKRLSSSHCSSLMLLVASVSIGEAFAQDCAVDFGARDHSGRPEKRCFGNDPGQITGRLGASEPSRPDGLWRPGDTGR